MYCKNCGKELPNENAEICLLCGTMKGKGDKCHKKVKLIVSIIKTVIC